MKNRMIKSGSIALGITILMGIVNYILGTMFKMIIGIKFWGGEVSSTYGFGIEFTRFYPESYEGETIASHAEIHFAPINFGLTVLGLWIVIFLICSIAEKRKKWDEQKSKRED